MTFIKQNELAIIYRIPSGEYEVSIKLKHPRTGEFMPPTDEDFGRISWTAYTAEKAERIFQEITRGERTVRINLEVEN